ncbi:MAG: DUF5615 family PIN-like protein [Acidobacteriota bacterium]
MKFLVDMGLSVSVVKYLTDQGHDGLHLRDLSLQRIEDHAIVFKALEEDRVILTHDLDFGRIVALSGARVPSVITFRLTDMRPNSVIRLLDQVLRTLSAQIGSGAMITVSDRNIRVRTLPVAGTDKV